MQTNLKRAEAVFRMRRGGSVATLAGVSFIVALATSVPSTAFAACGTSSSAGAHAAGVGSSGVHVASANTATSSGVKAATSGCPTGISTSALQGLTTTGSGRVVETGAHATRTETHAKNAAARTNATAHLRAVGHHA